MNNPAFNLSMALSDNSDRQSVGRSNHNLQKNFKCLTCERYFSSKHCLREHCFIHTGERPYTCQVCQKVLKHASQMSLHKKTHLPTHQITWPKLTSLLAQYLAPKPEPTDSLEQILLPLISGPQAYVIPIIPNS